MAVSQRKLRELVFQMVFSFDMNQHVDLALTTFLFDQLTVTKKTVRQAYERMQGVLEKLKEIDKHISRDSTQYDFGRISRVEKSILRLGVYELLYDEQIPPKVAIAEAVRLSRKFGTEGGGGFVNALLDSIHHKKNL